MKKSSENDQLTGHFQSFFVFSPPPPPPTLNLKKKSRKSTNKKNLAYATLQSITPSKKCVFIPMMLFR